MNKKWSSEEVANMLLLAQQGHNREDIAYTLDRSGKSVLHKLARLGLYNLVAKQVQKKWTIAEDAALAAHAESGLKREAIAIQMHRTVKSVEHRLVRLGLYNLIAVRSSCDRTRKAPEVIRQEYHARQLGSHTTTTAMLCGDPLPGRSALDQLRANA